MILGCTAQPAGGQPIEVQEEGTPAQDAPKPPTAEPDYSDQVAEYLIDILEDSRGHLWFGTLERGVARFDGETLRYFTKADGLSPGPVTSIAEDKQGRLWFGSHGGLSTYDGKTFQAAGTELKHDEWGFGVTSDRQGTIWVRTSSAVYRRLGASFVPFPLPIPKEKITRYAITAGKASLALDDSKGNLWFRTDGYGALRWDGTNFTHFGKEHGLPSNTVNGIAEDPQGRIWFICMQAYQPEMSGDGGLAMYDGKKSTTLKTFPDVTGLAGRDLYSLYFDRQGRGWVGASGHGMYHFEDDRFTLIDRIEKPHLSPNLGFMGILEDRKGTIWFGLAGGLYRLSGNMLANVSKSGPWN